MPRPYDPNQRQMAARVDRENPWWLVFYGVGSRRYWAFPWFEVPPGTYHDAASLDDLVTMMRETELRYPPKPYRPMKR